MNDRKKALEMELRQIIQADSMAVSVLRRADDTRLAVIQRTEKEKQEILAEADKRKKEVTEKVQGEIEAEVRQRMQDAGALSDEEQAALEQKMAEGRAGWVEEITRNILGDEGKNI